MSKDILSQKILPRTSLTNQCIAIEYPRFPVPHGLENTGKSLEKVGEKKKFSGS